MNQYKVIGRKMFDYYTTVTASSKEEAYDEAMKDDTDWFDIETDDIIEPIEVELIKDNSDEDVHIMDMSNGLIV